MAETLTWQIWIDRPWLSVLTWAVLVISLGTLIRPVVLSVSQQLFRIARFMLVKIAARLRLLAQRIQARNDQMLMALGRNYLERQIQRQSLHLQQALDKDLSQIEPQGLQLSKLVEKMEDDYVATREPVSEPPEWFRATESLLESRAAQDGNRTLQHLLEQLLERLRAESRLARQEYRQGIAERHELLNQFLPYWRRLLRMQGDIGQGVRRIEQRAERLEKLLERFHGMTTRRDRTLPQAVGSVVVHFLVAALVMMAIGALAVASFWSFSAGTQLLLPQVSSANLLLLSVGLICGQVLTGLVLLENMQVTRLFRAFWTVDGITAHYLRLGAFAGLCVWSLLNGTLAWLAAGIEWQALEQEAVPNGVLLVRVLLAALTPWLLILFIVPVEPLLNGVRILAGQLLALAVAIAGWTVQLLVLVLRALEGLWLALYELVCSPLVTLLALLQKRPGSQAEMKRSGKTEAG